MNIDRSKFLAFTMSIAAATVATTAIGCHASADDAASSEGAATEAAPTCTIKNAGKGSRSNLQSPISEGLCLNLASWTNPNATTESGKYGFDEFVWDQCQSYSKGVFPEVASQIATCLQGNDDQVPVPDSLKGVDLKEGGGHKVLTEAQQSDLVMHVYHCGWRGGLQQICYDKTADKANNGVNDQYAGVCDKMANAHPNQTDKDTCLQVMSGLSLSGRNSVRACIEKEGFDIYTCFEGARLADPGDGCLAENGIGEVDSNLAATCNTIASKDPSIGKFLYEKCMAYGSMQLLTPRASRTAMDCLTQAKDPGRSSYECGVRGLKSVCASKTDNWCQAKVVGPITAKNGHKDDNAGGKLTKQCNTLAPGLSAVGRKSVEGCIAGNDFLTFYSCVEGLGLWVPTAK